MMSRMFGFCLLFCANSGEILRVEAAERLSNLRKSRLVVQEFFICFPCFWAYFGIVGPGCQIASVEENCVEIRGVFGLQ